MYKLGIDICSVKRIQKVYEKYGEHFLHKILTATEFDYVVSRKSQLAESLAGRFAAKEAVAKALGVGWKGIYWQEIEVQREINGAPHIVLHGRAKSLAQELELESFQVSISHEREFAIATVLADHNPKQ